MFVAAPLLRGGERGRVSSDGRKHVAAEPFGWQPMQTKRHVDCNGEDETQQEGYHAFAHAPFAGRGRIHRQHAMRPILPVRHCRQP